MTPFRRLFGTPNRIFGSIVVAGTAIAFLVALSEAGWSPAALFLTPDQRGQLLMERKDPAAAAAAFEDPLRRGVALYRAGEFEAAAASFGRAETAEALYNRANAELMQGHYQAAIAAYRQALSKRPGWREARENLELARQRQQRLEPKNQGDEGTGGHLAPDEIVFDERAARASPDQTETLAGGTGTLSDEALRAMWLRRVQTRPADFLRARFSYQAAHQSAEEEPGGTP